MKLPVSLQRFYTFNKAFTVVELLIVISIIGILASIVIVSYSGSQQRANKSSINATAQQVKLKLGDYYTDNNVYPTDLAAVTAYLNSTNSSALATALNASYNGQPFKYTACVNGSDPVSCNTTNCTPPSAPCVVYKLQIDKAAWKGDSSDSPTIYVTN